MVPRSSDFCAGPCEGSLPPLPHGKGHNRLDPSPSRHRTLFPWQPGTEWNGSGDVWMCSPVHREWAKVGGPTSPLHAAGWLSPQALSQSLTSITFIYKVEISHLSQMPGCKGNLLLPPSVLQLLSLGTCCTLLGPQILLPLTPGDQGASLNYSPFFGSVCSGIPALHHRGLMTRTIQQDPDAVTQQWAVLRHRTSPREGRSLLKLHRIVPSLLLCHCALGTLRDRLLCHFLWLCICAVFYVIQRF